MPANIEIKFTIDPTSVRDVEQQLDAFGRRGGPGTGGGGGGRRGGGRGDGGGGTAGGGGGAAGGGDGRMRSVGRALAGGAAVSLLGKGMADFTNPYVTGQQAMYGSISSVGMLAGGAAGAMAGGPIGAAIGAVAGEKIAEVLKNILGLKSESVVHDKLMGMMRAEAEMMGTVNLPTTQAWFDSRRDLLQPILERQDQNVRDMNRFAGGTGSDFQAFQESIAAAIKEGFREAREFFDPGQPGG